LRWYSRFPHGDYYAWVEWYPAPSQRIGLNISPGDYIAVMVANIGGRHVVTVDDKSKHMSVSVVLSPPPGGQLQGDTAEWVIERPTVNGTLSNLAPYCGSGWRTPQAQFQQGAKIVRPSVPGTGTTYIVSIVTQDNSTQISTPTLYPGSPDDAIWFDTSLVPCK
jgi:hypothetical protein